MIRSNQFATRATELSMANPLPSPSFWLDLAACREVDPEIFFPIGAAGAALGQRFAA